MYNKFKITITALKLSVTYAPLNIIDIAIESSNFGAVSEKIARNILSDTNKRHLLFAAYIFCLHELLKKYDT